MTSPQHQTLHDEHRRWTQAAALWHDDLRAWERETHESEASLGTLRAALKRHLTSLQTHAAAVKLSELQIAEHERSLAQFEQYADSAQLVGLAPRHHQQAQHQERLRAQHEQLKQRHHAKLAALRAALKALECAD